MIKQRSGGGGVVGREDEEKLLYAHESSSWEFWQMRSSSSSTPSLYYIKFKRIVQMRSYNLQKRNTQGTTRWITPHPHTHTPITHSTPEKPHRCVLNFHNRWEYDRDERHIRCMNKVAKVQMILEKKMYQNFENKGCTEGASKLLCDSWVFATIVINFVGL